MSDLRICFSIFLLLILFSCGEKNTGNQKNSETEKITSIGFTNIGGQLGYYKIIKINKDSVFVETGETSTGKHSKWSASLKSQTWETIISGLKIKDLDSIKSSQSIQPIDGIDESFQIKTNKKSHVYVNAQNDPHYDQFINLKIQIAQILPKEYQQ